MERSYHFSINNQPVGPLDEAAIRQHIEQGDINGETLAWCDGMAEWQPAHQIEELTAQFGELKARPAQPPPLPGEQSAGGTPPPPPPGGGSSGSESDVPAGLSGLEAQAYRFVLAIFRGWGGRPTPVRAYVMRNPKRAVPVAAATLVIMALVLFSLPSFLESPQEPPGTAPQQTAQQGMQQPPANWQESYRAWRDTQQYGQGVTDEVIRGNQRSWDRQSDSYRCGTYGMCGDNK